MDEDLYEIAKNNVAQKKKLSRGIGWGTFIAFVGFCISMIIAQETGSFYHWFLFAFGMIAWLYWLYKVEKSIVGKEDPVLKEMKRLAGDEIIIHEPEKLKLKRKEELYRDRDLL